jgi:hypothetical protein
MHRRITTTCIVLTATLITFAGDAHAATVCQNDKGAGYPWSWRLIDGKRCWYKGNPGMDKNLLRWAESTPAPRAASTPAPRAASAPAPRAASASAPTPKRRPPSTLESFGEVDQLLHSYWPPLPPADVFGDRFDAVRGLR